MVFEIGTFDCPECGERCSIKDNGEIEVQCAHVWGIGPLSKYPMVQAYYEKIFIEYQLQRIFSKSLREECRAPLILAKSEKEKFWSIEIMTRKEGITDYITGNGNNLCSAIKDCYNKIDWESEVSE